MLLLLIIIIITHTHTHKRKYECFLLCRLQCHLEREIESYFWNLGRYKINSITIISHEHQHYFEIGMITKNKQQIIRIQNILPVSENKLYVMSLELHFHVKFQR